ncbi:MAG: hypothetical protein NC420_11060 [Eubacterium sp.]|nr:hypothetical protein [Eubacterium sp.]
MVKINKSRLPKGIIIKKEEDYRSESVILLLQKDFYNKCYLCEEKNPTSINVEHFRSCKNNEALKYNWENLFYACAHCNRIKGSRYDHIIDCTKDDPEMYIHISFQSYPKNYVEVSSRLYCSKNIETQELLDKIYNGAGTPISEFEASNLKCKISDEIKEFIEYIEKYLNENDVGLRKVYWKRIKKMLSRESNFSGFKRSIIMESKEYMQCFGELLS